MACPVAQGNRLPFEFGFSIETSQAYSVRTIMIALAFSLVHPLGFGIAATALLLGFWMDRFMAARADGAARAELQMGAGLGDIKSCQYMLKLVAASVVVHALLLLPWIEALRWAPNLFLAVDKAPARYLLSAYIYPLLLFVVATISHGKRAQSLVAAAAFGFGGVGFLFTLPQIFPVPAVLSLLVAVFLCLLLGSMALYNPLGYVLGRADPAGLCVDREKDYEAYYTRETMPFDPRHVMNAQVELLCDGCQP
jgi:hypothetical protein